MFRKHIITTYINGNVPDVIIGHSSSMFIKPTLVVILLLFVLYGIFSVVDYYIDHPYLLWIFVALGILLLIKYTLDFLDFYLDCLVISTGGITLFRWEWVFEYKTDYFERHTIETISHTQNSFRDKLFNKGDLSIMINHAISFPFDDVDNPRKMAKLIQHTQEKHGLRFEHEEDEEEVAAPAADYSVLMEALGEVVQEYVQKKKKKSYDDDYPEDDY
jgi:hypothetical protein